MGAVLGAVVRRLQLVLGVGHLVAIGTGQVDCSQLSCEGVDTIHSRASLKGVWLLGNDTPN